MIKLTEERRDRKRYLSGKIEVENISYKGVKYFLKIAYFVDRLKKLNTICSNIKIESRLFKASIYRT